MRALGGYLGYNSPASRLAAPGVWTLRDQCRLKAVSQWPTFEPDPFFSYVSLLLSMNGANGSTAFVDSSLVTKTVQASGALISTAQGMFGTASAFFNGDGSFLRCIDSGDQGFAFGAGDFTIEWWFLSTATNNYATMMSRDYFGPGGIAFFLNGNSGNGRPEIFWREYANALFIQSSVGGFNDGAWHHFAFVRQGMSCFLYLDGQSRGSRLGVSTSVPSSDIIIGNDRVFAGRDFSGHIDDVRVTKGVCRYPGGTSFTPPTQAFAAY